MPVPMQSKRTMHVNIPGNPQESSVNFEMSVSGRSDEGASTPTSPISPPRKSRILPRCKAPPPIPPNDSASTIHTVSTASMNPSQSSIRTSRASQSTVPRFSSVVDRSFIEKKYPNLPKEKPKQEDSKSSLAISSTKEQPSRITFSRRESTVLLSKDAAASSDAWMREVERKMQEITTNNRYIPKTRLPTTYCLNPSVPFYASGARLEVPKYEKQDEDDDW